MSSGTERKREQLRKDHLSQMDSKSPFDKEREERETEKSSNCIFFTPASEAFAHTASQGWGSYMEIS